VRTPITAGRSTTLRSGRDDNFVAKLAVIGEKSSIPKQICHPDDFVEWS
jgi:hypothetical protein